MEEKLECRQCGKDISDCPYFFCNWGEFCSEECANKYIIGEEGTLDYSEWKGE